MRNPSKTGTPGRSRPKRRVALSAFAALALTMLSLLVIPVPVATATPADAAPTTPTSETTSAGMAQGDGVTSSSTMPGGVTATQADDNEGPGPNAGGTAGLVVFLVVMTVIMGGAGILYLKHRRR